MIKYFFSKIDQTKLLHVVVAGTPTETRVDVSPSEQFLQVALIAPEQGKTFKRHYHTWKDAATPRVVAQESWVVISGSVKVNFYDVDNEPLSEEIMTAGNCSITFEGGHAYEILEKDTVIYEFKTGPYNGRANDKEFF